MFFLSVCIHMCVYIYIYVHMQFKDANVMQSEESHTNSENLFLRNSNLKLLVWKISILSSG